MHALPHAPCTADGRLKARLKPGHGISAFHDGEGVDILDMSDVGFKLKNDGQFEADKTFVFDVVFQEDSAISGWRLRAQCRWTSTHEAGFLFELDRFGQSLSAVMSRQPVRGRQRVLNGIEL